MREICEEVVKLLREGRPGVVATVTAVSGSVPRHPGSKMLVRDDGSIVGSVGGGKVEADVIQQALQLMGTEKAVKREYTLTEDQDILCGGKVEILLEPFGAVERAFLFGAGHVGQALAPLLKKAGFHLTVVDDRPEFANAGRFSEADEVYAGDYAEILPKLRFTPNTYVIIVTHAHRFDETVLEYCLKQPAKYLGMIGSKKKTLTILNHLKEKGFSDEELSRVYSPVGLNIGAETPFEIGISILAEMIAVRHGVDTGAASMRLTGKR